MINPDNISVSSAADKSTSSQDYMSGRNFMKPDALINPASSSDACGTSYTVINPASLYSYAVINKANPASSKTIPRQVCQSLAGNSKC